MKNYLLTEETLGYVTAENQTNTDERHLVAGSQNVYIDNQRKVRSRFGVSRFGAANSTRKGIKGAITWENSNGGELPIRFKNGEMQVYLGTVDDTEVDAWTQVASGFSDTATPRFTTWYDNGESIDLLLFVIGNDNIYEWGGGVAVVASVTGTTITKEGTTTFAQNRFYTTGSKTVVCVRTGTEYTYTGGEGTTTLTGIADTTGLQAGDILVQKIVTQTDKPSANRNNHTIYTFENQLCVASDDDEQVYVSANDDYTDFTFSSPRITGEGELFTLDNPAKGFGELTNRLIIFAGSSSIYQAEPFEITVGTTLTETFKVKKYQTGINQSARSQEFITQIGSSIVYLSFEPALRELVSLEQLQGGGEPRTLSNPIEPDFLAEDWSDGAMFWHESDLHISAPTNGRIYILTYDEDADGALRRFWQPPQTNLFISRFFVYAGDFYGHSSAISESYKLFDPETFSDINSSDEKTAITAIAKYAYRSFGKRFNLKNFDEYCVEGEISPSTDLEVILNFDFGGQTQQVTDTIEGSNTDILDESLENVSLAQQPLGQQPLGGSVNAPDSTAKFRAIIELAKEDFFEIQAIFKTDAVDKYWSIIAHGPNASLSARQPINKKI